MHLGYSQAVQQTKGRDRAGPEPGLSSVQVWSVRLRLSPTIQDWAGKWIFHSCLVKNLTNGGLKSSFTVGRSTLLISVARLLLNDTYQKCRATHHKSAITTAVDLHQQLLLQASECLTETKLSLCATFDANIVTVSILTSHTIRLYR